MNTEYPILKYDDNGNVIYYEDSTGYGWKREYDDNRNRIYYESSSGFWCKREYDDKGNNIYFENAYGYWWEGFINKKTEQKEGIEIYGKNL